MILTLICFVNVLLKFKAIQLFGLSTEFNVFTAFNLFSSYNSFYWDIIHVL